jgi:hypothetical protein
MPCRAPEGRRQAGGQGRRHRHLEGGGRSRRPDPRADLHAQAGRREGHGQVHRVLGRAGAARSRATRSSSSFPSTWARSSTPAQSTRTPQGDGQVRKPQVDVDRQAGCVQEEARGRGGSRASGGCLTAPEARLRPGVGREDRLRRPDLPVRKAPCRGHLLFLKFLLAGVAMSTKVKAVPKRTEPIASPQP